MATIQSQFFFGVGGGQFISSQQLREKEWALSLAVRVPRKTPTVHGFSKKNSYNCVVAAALSASTKRRLEWQLARQVQTRITIAASIGRLDLSECNLKELPAEVFDLTELVELSCSGNHITSLPDRFDRLPDLKKLGLSGNRLQELPGSVGHLQQLEGLWVHGNLLRSLPPEIGDLQRLRRLALAGNRLTVLPETLTRLTDLQTLSVAGNELEKLPSNIGALTSLQILAAHGNRLSSIPESLTNLSALQELWLQSNLLEDLPSEWGGLCSLKQLSLADNLLFALPESIGSLTALEAVWLYSNKLSELPKSFGRLKKLTSAWVENNPLKGDAFRDLSPALEHIRTVGISSNNSDLCDHIAPNISISSTLGTGAAAVCGGYFKLQAHGEGQEATSSSTSDVLVVAFGSAPGLPNWGGLLKKVKASMRQEDSILPAFDILYVVDSCRSWYTHGQCQQQDPNGEEERRLVSYYESEIRKAVEDYKRIIMLGDSMGASGALIFSHLATDVIAFCPQVDLTTSSIRPGRDQTWLKSYTDELLSSVSRSSADISVHCGSWSHDIEQAKLLPSAKVTTVRHGVDDHRLAKELDSRGQLMAIVKCKIIEALGSSVEKA